MDPIDPARCPLCGGDNRCALRRAAPATAPCWCAAVTIAPAVLAALPAAAVGRACVCPGCASGAPAAPPTPPPAQP